jgi:hypothetical protein
MGNNKRKSLPQAMNIPGRGNIDLSDVSQSYGGTIYGTTPGGTRIVYTMDMLMNCRNSPLSKTPPASMPEIPGVTIGTPYVPEDDEDEDGPEVDDAPEVSGHEEDTKDGDELFELDDK